MSSKKCKTIAIICFIASALCAVGFVVSGFFNMPGKTERFLNRYEKLCNAGKLNRIEKLYFEDKNTLPAVAEVYADAKKPGLYGTIVIDAEGKLPAVKVLGALYRGRSAIVFP